MIEKRILQLVIILGCCVPVIAGINGFLYGIGSAHDVAGDVDNHFRYLSGLLLGIGLAFLSTVPHIEFHTQRFRLLTFVVFIGGVCRLIGLLIVGHYSISITFALLMELVVTPSLCLWQNRLAKKIV